MEVVSLTYFPKKCFIVVLAEMIMQWLAYYNNGVLEVKVTQPGHNGDLILMVAITFTFVKFLMVGSGIA